MKETNYYDHFMSIGGHSDALFKFLKWKNSKIFQFFRNYFAKRIREKILKNLRYLNRDKKRKIE